MTFTINIGLLNNPKTAKEMIAYLKTLRGYELLQLTQSSGSYHDLIEPTIVAELETKYTLLSKVVADVENICSVLEQDCIAISNDQFDLLVYSIKYFGPKDKFDEDYFITI
jgi:hypothetical protein